MGSIWVLVSYLGRCGLPKPTKHRRRMDSTVEDGHRNVKDEPLIHQEPRKRVHFTSGHLNPTPELTTYGGIKLGWIQGVLIPCLLNIWGVMLFLRIAWIVAQAGIGLTMVIILISGIVCVVTTLSLSAICTNGEVQGGGVYYLVSRSLGAELGASVGIIFAFANAVAASMNTIGFCDSLNELLKSHGVKIIDNSVNDTRIVGVIALFTMCVICAIGMDWETKTQNFLIVVIVVAITNYIIGASIGPQNDNEKAEGFIGINMDNAQKNWYPDFRFSEGEYHNFFSVFAMYFPAMTGVQAGANICGDLREPNKAIPKGTLLALAISMTSYFTMAVLSGLGGLRDASGNVADLANNVLDACKPNCDYGLHNNYKIMQLMALWDPLIYAGCWAATLSTALTNLLSVPRLIQALGIDRIYPGLIFFSKPYGRYGEPYRGYVLTFLVSAVFLLIADLNKIAPLITNFYLASYALINFCTFHAAFVHQISWRPTFRCYNKWLSLLGFLMCVTIMMIISWAMALTTASIFITLYLIVLYRKPDANWGSSTEGQKYRETVSSILNMSQRREHVKSYNPQVLVMAGKPYDRPILLDIGHLITKIGSFMIVADIERGKLSYTERKSRCVIGEEWVRSEKHRAFYVLLDEHSLETGAAALTQTTGLGRLSPNILLLGYLYNWPTKSQEKIGAYFRIIQNAYNNEIPVTIMRAPNTARPSKDRRTSSLATLEVERSDLSIRVQSHIAAVMHPDSDIDTDDTTTKAKHQDQEGILKTSQKSENMLPKKKKPQISSRNVMNSTYKPLVLTNDKCVDAWWLYDDGGLNILLPYIIARRGAKDKMSLRIFALAKGQRKEADARLYMESLLKKLRIEYSELILVQGIGDAPSEASWKLFNELITNFNSSEKNEILVSDTELQKQHAKTSRNLRLREMLLEHSSRAALVVMTLPHPRQGSVSAALYLSWLEMLSKGLPPMLFVRGNDSYVLDA
ncbi:hypothetical protein K1T71_009207 [Dendrolimus kikuchii]|uniref:Uncharacterized protein n=1 Tax=Dendrolimus kikuchii TaxID=765133 RepID=A0ACC1CTS8_9NEOP|nr:hypothetical protein K1T71_009207 [Dendrolimus kikuchii]